MSIKSALHSYLKDHPAVKAALGNDPSRIEPVALSQSTTRPAITYQRLPSGHDHNLKGATGSSLGKFRLTCWGDIFKDADDLSEILRGAMQGFSGTMDTTRVGAVLLVNDFDSYSEPQTGTGKASFMVHHDYEIRYEETVPQFQ